jgi:hypothetical protein
MVVLFDRFSAGRIDEMHSTACNAIHCFIILRFRLAPLVGDPALYAQARVGAAVKECCHGLITESSRDRNRAGA